MIPIRPQFVSTEHVAPVVAGPLVAPVNGIEDSFVRPEDSPLGVDKQSAVDGFDDQEEVDAETGELSVRPMALPTPKMPSPAVVAHHNLTHYPYRSWCPWCAAARRPNSHHTTCNADRSRNVPMFCADYCFPKDQADPSTITVCVGRMKPSMSVFASVCDTKGPEDQYCLSRLENFLKEEGVSKIAYRSDQEASIIALIERALHNCGKAGTVTDAVPEHSAVGESSSNGTAENTVLQVEGQMRTLKAALEARLGARLPNTHPVMRWLVQHVASILNRQSTNPEGMTPYEYRHGRRSHGRTAEFGERLLYYVPKRLRAKIDLRWRVGIFLGTADRSNEAFIGTRSGNVVKSRSLARVVAENKWDADSVLRITGTPAQMCPNPDGNQDSTWVEAEIAPHEHAHDPSIDQQADDTNQPGSAPAKMLDVDRGKQRIRITKQDLVKYGYSPGCKRCLDIQAGKHLTREHHSEECRYRLYSEFETHHDAKWESAKRELGIDCTDTNLGPVDPEVGALDALDKHIDDRQQHTKSTARNSDEPAVDEAADDAELVADGVDREAFPDDQAVDVDSPEDVVADLFMSDAEDEGNQMLDALMLAGVDPPAANLFAARVSPSSRPETFFEVYGRGSIVAEALKQRRSLNVQGLHAMDLRTQRPDGTPWNFLLKEHRHDARRLQMEMKPTWLIGSPPCTPWSIWNVGINYRKMDPSVVSRMLEEGRIHLRFCVDLYRRQLKHGRHFLHEHPASALSWKEPVVEALAKSLNVYVAKCDQCQFGLLTKSADGQGKSLAMKPTMFMTSSQAMAECLDRKCDRSHVHQHLEGGRAAEAAFYPLALIRAILRGIRATADAENRVTDSKIEQRELINAMSMSHGAVPMPQSHVELPSSFITRTNGGKIKINYGDENFKFKYMDEYTGETLDPALIRAAIVEELIFFNEKQIWQLEDLSKVKQIVDAIHVRTRWVLCNKGDADNPDMRARLVACEVNKTGKEDAFFASTPPGESKNILFSQFPSRRRKTMADGSVLPLRLSFIDIKKAYFNGVPSRQIYMSLPPELGLPKHFVAKQTRCVYGTRDAGMIWEQCYRDALEAMGFVSGVSNPCLFFIPTETSPLLYTVMTSPHYPSTPSLIGTLKN